MRGPSKRQAPGRHNGVANGQGGHKDAAAMPDQTDTRALLVPAPDCHLSGALQCHATRQASGMVVVK